MSVNVKQNGELVKIANNISMVQANWNDRENTSKTSCIRNQPATLKTLQEINDNTDENALVSANAVKELADSIDGTSNIVYLTKAQYEALPETKLTDGVEYRITDANTTAKIAATDVTYGDTTVQAAISEVSESLERSVGILTSTLSSDFLFNKCTKSGNVIQVCFGFSDASISVTGTSDIATLPVGFRPTEKTYISGYVRYNGVNNTAPFEIRTDGIIRQLYATGAVDNIKVLGTFII